MLVAELVLSWTILESLRISEEDIQGTGQKWGKGSPKMTDFKEISSRARERPIVYR